MPQILDRLPEVVAQLRATLGLPVRPGDDESVGQLGFGLHSGLDTGAAVDAGTHAGTGAGTGLSETDLLGRLSADDVELFTQTAAEVMKLGEALVTIGAGQIAKLSDRELGYSGLAQRRGLRTPEQLVQSITGSTRGEAAKQVRVGTALGEAQAAERLRAAVEREAAAQPKSDDGSGGGDPEVAFRLPVDVPWHSPVSLAVANGELSATAAGAITRGLGEPTDTVPAELLRSAAERLLLVAATTDADELSRLAREERNQIDVAGIAERENALREMRGLRMLRRDATGMRGVAIRLDPENEALFSGLIDAATSPRRGGPRFVDPEHVAAAERLERDPRSTEQIALDTLIHLMEVGAKADPDTVFDRMVSVRFIVAAEGHQRPGATAPGGPAEQGHHGLWPGHAGEQDESGCSVNGSSPQEDCGSDRNRAAGQDDRESGPNRAAVSGSGHDGGSCLTSPGMLEDSREQVSAATVERAMCVAELTAILLGSDNVPFESSISMRLFNRRQRRALAARDGGCMFPGCDRPVSWTEAHHIVPWKTSKKTQVIDGILLCRHHHMLVHNNGWVIVRRVAAYYLVPPASIDPEQKEILLESKSALMRRRKQAGAPTQPAVTATG